MSGLAEFDALSVRRVPVEGGEMVAVDCGDGPAVVLVHGSPVSALEFRALIARLASEFRVIAPDLLTFGRSTGPAAGADFGLQARALRGLIDALQLERFHLMVHDWGGAIGLGAAARRPEQVDRLVLQNTSVRPDWRPPLYWRLMIAPGAGEVALLRANAFGHGLPLMLRAARRDRELRERHRAPLRDPATRRTVLRLERMEGYAEECTGVIRALPDLGGPQLILWGQPDPAYLGEAPRLRALFPGARFVPIPGAGHFAAEDAAERVSEEVHAFLTG